jgi:hypothetical protein
MVLQAHKHREPCQPICAQAGQSCVRAVVGIIMLVNGNLTAGVWTVLEVGCVRAWQLTGCHHPWHSILEVLSANCRLHLLVDHIADHVRIYALASYIVCCHHPRTRPLTGSATKNHKFWWQVSQPRLQHGNC